MNKCRFRFDDVLMYVLLGEGGDAFCRYFPLQSDARAMLARVKATCGVPKISSRTRIPPASYHDLVMWDHRACVVEQHIHALEQSIARESRRPYMPLSEKDAEAYSDIIRKLRYEPTLKQFLPETLTRRPGARGADR